MKTKLLILILLASLLTAAVWRPSYPDIIYLPTPARLEVVCSGGQIPGVWVHHNVAVVRCD